LQAVFTSEEEGFGLKNGELKKYLTGCKNIDIIIWGILSKYIQTCNV
jgi:hypothetical protein